MRLINSGEKCVKIMNTGEKREDEGGCRTVCYSPASVFVAIAKKCRNGGRRQKLHPRERVHENHDSRNSDDRRRINVSGIQSQEMSFNLAAGLGLLSLIAASKTELDKTVELRKQMEVYLESFKEESLSKVTTPKLSDPEIAYAVSTTLDGPSNYSMDDNAPSLSQQESVNNLVYDSHCSVHQKEETMQGINHLEEELAAELDRMQIDVKAGGYIENEEPSDIQADITEMPSENTVAGSASMSSEEVIDPQYVENSEFNGVPPLELERRLHLEVLETRQEERIKELEAHLESMKRKLQEKEIEAAWWKDTAKVISQQIPQSTRALR